MPAVLRRVYLGTAGLVLLSGAAQLALWAGRVDPATFPRPTAVLASAADLARNGSFLASVGDTMATWAEAMAIAVVIAVPVGLLLAAVPWAEPVVRPVIEFVRPVPAVVLVPLVLLIVQDNQRTEVVVVVFACVWPVLINTVYGVRSVEPLAVETLRSFGFGPLSVGTPRQDDTKRQAALALKPSPELDLFEGVGAVAHGGQSGRNVPLELIVKRLELFRVGEAAGALHAF